MDLNLGRVGKEIIVVWGNGGCATTLFALQALELARMHAAKSARCAPAITGVLVITTITTANLGYVHSKTLLQVPALESL